MLKQEFTDLIGIPCSDLSEEDYRVIELVYNYHPAIPNIDGKNRIAKLYEIGGIGLIRDMEDTAQYAANLELAIEEAKAKLADADAELGNAMQDYESFKAKYKA